MWKSARRTGVAAALLAGVLIASGCSGGGGGGGDGDEAESVFIHAITEDPRGFNAQFISAPVTSMFSSQILQTLIRLSNDYEVSPGLAESWELSDDGLELTLNLRQGVTWHDGEPFTAEDVKFNFEEIVPLSSFGSLLAERLSEVEIVDDSTVVLRLDEPYGPFIETIASQFMVPKHIYEGTDYVTNETNMAPIGTGPMMFESYDSGEQIELVKNPDYWEGEVQVDRAIYPIMSDPNSRAEALFAGEIDQADLGVAHQERVAETESTQALEGTAFPQDLMVLFNARPGPLEDPEVRAAVFSLIDREKVVETALGGMGTPAKGFFPESLDWAVSPNVDFATDYPHDVDAANKVLDEAGLERGPDGTRFTLRLHYVTDRTAASRTAELTQSMLEEVGIESELVASAVAVYTEKVYTEHDFDLAFQRATAGTDPSVGMGRWYTCNKDDKPHNNPSGICDEELDQAAADALDSANQEARGEAFTRFQDRAGELMYTAPLAWFEGAFPPSSISTTRWNGLDEPQPITNGTPWLTMTPVE